MRPTGPRCSNLGLLMAMLALLGQIALGSTLPNPAVISTLGPFGDLPICHSGLPDGSASGAPAGHPQHGMQCALCPVCHALAAAAFLPVPAPQPLAPPTARIAGHPPLPPARAPPATAILAATYPTGPPDLA